MIDAFWTKWRVRRLCRGDATLVGKWLDDYVGWLYGRLWGLSGYNAAQTEQTLVDVFSFAARHLNQWLRNPHPMSEWLLTWIDSQKFSPAVKMPSVPGIQDQVQVLWTHSLSEMVTLSPELLDISQRALSLLSRDDQEVMVCRYVRMETLAELAAHSGKSIAEIQGLLYRARHSFRRSLESLTQTASSQSEKSILADQDVLDANLEKLFSSLGPKPMPAAESLAALKARILDTLVRQSAADLQATLRRWAIPAAIIVFLLMVWVGVGVFGPDGQSQPPVDVSKTPAKTKQAAAEPNLVRDVDINAQVNHAAALGQQRDIEGLLEILKNGPYAAQLIAAHHLGLFGDKSVIDALDIAAQKWYPDKPLEDNPFVDAIASIEARARELQKQQELEKKKQELLEKTLPLIQKRLEKSEPNRMQAEPNKPKAEPNSPQRIPAAQAVQPEPNATGIEPNTLQTEPNEPNAVKAATTPDASDANQPADANVAF